MNWNMNTFQMKQWPTTIGLVKNQCQDRLKVEILIKNSIKVCILVFEEISLISNIINNIGSTKWDGERDAPLKPKGPLNQMKDISERKDFHSSELRRKIFDQGFRSIYNRRPYRTILKQSGKLFQ